jgi:hypothetical protein
MLSVIPGLSDEKAASVVKVYPTIKSLMEAYDEFDTVAEKEQMLENLEIQKIVIDSGNAKRLGKALSRKIYVFLKETDPNAII